MIVVLDEFLPDPDSLRAQALEADYIDWPGLDGQIYKRISMVDLPEVRELIERNIGPCDWLGMAYRLNYGGELPNQAIHTDLGWGTHALVLYLCDGEGGTAFWRHRETGLQSLMAAEHFPHDWDNPEKWEITELAALKYNRAVIYDSSLFHSRWPFAAFGDGPEDGRLILVAFFTPEWAYQEIDIRDVA